MDDLFEEYAKLYDLNDFDIGRKYDHMKRVKILSRMIAESLNMSKRDIYLAEILGLYHDISRFEQLKKYHTYNDKKSFDHGDVGADNFKDNFASKLDLTKEEIDLIYKAIKYHNKLDIGDVNEREEIFCKLIRDADKLDIMYIYINIKGFLNPADDSEISELCLNDFFNKKLTSWKNVKTNNERLLVALAFIWDINFDFSFKLIKENKYYEKLEKIINSDKFNEIFKFIYKELEDK